MTTLHKVRRLFSIHGKVDRGTYAIVGFSVTAIKYLLDATIIYIFFHQVWTPMSYLSPLLETKNGLGKPGLLYLTLSLIPNLWLGLAMSLKRLRDIGRHPLLCLFFLTPYLNYAFMLCLCVLPSRSSTATSQVKKSDQPPHALVYGFLIGGLLASLFAATGVAVLGVTAGRYGPGLFLMVPFAAGAIHAFIWSRSKAMKVRREAMKIAVFTSVASSLLIMAFAFEGVICIGMALPLTFTLTYLGAHVGLEFGSRIGVTAVHLGPLLILPFAIGLSEPEDNGLREVRSTKIIHASIGTVWENVIAFSEIPDSPPWLDSLGIAYPLRARIEGRGVGAIRHCEFTTGSFVEPITEWEPPTRLGFSVAKHPPTMTETNPFHVVHPRHLNGYFESKRGQFQLTALNESTTEVTGSTWYTLKIYPGWYWSWLADGIVHAIHARVLDHVAQLAENESGSRR